MNFNFLIIKNGKQAKMASNPYDINFSLIKCETYHTTHNKQLNNLAPHRVRIKGKRNLFTKKEKKKKKFIKLNMPSTAC